MPRAIGSCLLSALLLALPLTLSAQTPGSERAAPHTPSRPVPASDQKRQEALKLYGQALLQEKKNRLLSAVETLEAALELDPEAAPILKSLAPLYLALDRVEDALEAWKKYLKLNPDDYATSFNYASQLLELNRRAEALAVLQKTTRCKGIEEQWQLLSLVWLHLGSLQEQEKNWKEAEKSYREVLAILDKPRPFLGPGNATAEEAAADLASQVAETWERIGDVCRKAGRFPQAIEAFQAARKKDRARGPRLAFRLAQVYEKQGQFEAALAQVNEYLRGKPQGAEGYEKKIALLRKLKRESEIVPDLRAALKQEPNNTSLAVLLAREYRRSSPNKGEAEILYKQLLGSSRAPSPELYRGLFDLYKEEGRTAGARVLELLDQAYKKVDEKQEGDWRNNGSAQVRAMLIACRDDPELVKWMLEASQTRLQSDRFTRRAQRLSGSTLQALASLASRTRQLRVAEELYRSCLNLPGRRGTYEAEVYSGLLRVLRMQHRHADIVALCRSGLEKAQATNRVLFHRYLARSLAILGRGKEALEAADAAVADAGGAELLDSRCIRIGLLSDLGKHDQAISECQAQLKEYNLRGDVRQVRLTLSAAYEAAGRHDDADHELQLILRADPKDATAYNALGYHWADRNKNLAEAEKLIRTALDLDREQRRSGDTTTEDTEEENAAFVDSLGWVLFRRGRLEEARKELERAVSLPGGDDDPVVLDHLGDLYFRLGLPAQALKTWQKALGLYDQGVRASTDERYQEIQGKVRLVKP
jgi:tetratricopeptide (TPR) repeat protein